VNFYWFNVQIKESVSTSESIKKYYEKAFITKNKSKSEAKDPSERKPNLQCNEPLFLISSELASPASAKLMW